MLPPPEGREAAIEHTLETMRVIAGSGFPFEEERMRQEAARSFDRSFYPAGPARQLAAILASGSRVEALRQGRRPDAGDPR